MEEVNKQKTRNILPSIFICMAILLLVIHLVVQIAETNKPEKELTDKDLKWPEKPVESLKPDSIWEGTEFIPE